MSLETKRELVVAIGERYRAADRKSKKAILDEFAKVTGYHRKHAIRVLRKGKPVVERKSVGKRIYQQAVEESLIVVWEAADRICGKRLKALMPTLVDAMERHGHLKLEETVRGLLLRMSAATIDRRLKIVVAKPLGQGDRSVLSIAFEGWQLDQ